MFCPAGPASDFEATPAPLIYLMPTVAGRTQNYIGQQLGAQFSRLPVQDKNAKLSVIMFRGGGGRVRENTSARCRRRHSTRRRGAAGTRVIQMLPKTLTPFNRNTIVVCGAPAIRSKDEMNFAARACARTGQDTKLHSAKISPHQSLRAGAQLLEAKKKLPNVISTIYVLT